ncbi:MAG: amino acid ABC transporter permease [Stomatobaculum sp.]|nr:amino acid ABC transporter permease [Stomatobaculum sp.]
MLTNISKIWAKYSFVYIQGLIGTIWLSIVVVALGTVLGTLLAVLKLSRFKPGEWFVNVYLEIIRGTPVLLQIYFFWSFLPKVSPIELSDTGCIVVALIFNAAAYIAEIIRSGIEAVDAGQTEAALSLGMTSAHTMTRVVMPQAIKNILPAMVNEFITEIKQTSLASVFFVNELTTAYKTVQSTTFLSIPSLMISGMIYLALSFILTRLMAVLERRLKSNDR